MEKNFSKEIYNLYYNTYGQEDTVIQSLYDEFEKHNLDTNIIGKITKKKRKRKRKKPPKIRKKKKEGKKEGFYI